MALEMSDLFRQLFADIGPRLILIAGGHELTDHQQCQRIGLADIVGGKIPVHQHIARARKPGVIRKIECSQIVPQTRDVAFAFVGGIVFDLLQRRPVEQLCLAHELPRPAGTVGLLEFDAEFGGKIVRRQIAAFPCGRVGRIVRIIEPAARRVHIFG